MKILPDSLPRYLIYPFLKILNTVLYFISEILLKTGFFFFINETVSECKIHLQSNAYFIDLVAQMHYSKSLVRK